MREFTDREIGALRRIACVPLRFAAALAAVVLFGMPTFARPAGPHRRHVRTARHHTHHHHHRLSARHHHQVRHAARSAGPARETILIDADTGEVLQQSNADARTYPASLTKMMTLYLTFQELKKHKLGLDQRLPVSPHAAAQGPTKLWLKPGDSVLVRNLILALITRSANDAAVVLAEGMAGSESAFAERMTATARRLGMTRTVFRNASGLPDHRQHTTARDMARLALALYRDFPQRYGYFATREFDFRGKTITGHNHLLETYRGADGIKTGFIRASGFNLAASAERDGHRLIGVVLGGSSAHQRDRRMAALLDHGFAELEAPKTAVAAADRVVRKDGDSPTSSKLAAAGARLASLLAPAAEAAPLARPKVQPAVARRSAPARGRCGIQIGAFRAREDAKKVAHTAARLPLAKGKSVHIVKPARGRKKGLYRVRLIGFTKPGATAACVKLKGRMPCMVIPPRH